MVVCKDEDLADIRHRAMKVEGGGEAITELINLSFETIEKTFNE